MNNIQKFFAARRNAKLPQKPAEDQSIEPAESNQTTVGHTVRSLNTVRQRMITRSSMLRHEIERLTEELRQSDVTIRSLDLAIGSLAEDPGLTVDEQTIAASRATATLSESDLVDALQIAPATPNGPFVFRG
jgi:hypothetical protein